MRAREFLNEVGILGIDGTGVKDAETVTITIPKKLLNIQADANPKGEEVEEDTEDTNMPVVEPTDPDGDEIADLVRLSGGGANDPKQGPNHTIAAPASDVVPENPVFISPLQQQLELQKQQGGKESHHINQIINQTALGSTASEQPEQSVYHDSPLKDNEYIGAGTGAVDKLRNATTTQGANKPWYKI